MIDLQISPLTLGLYLLGALYSTLAQACQSYGTIPFLLLVAFAVYLYSKGRRLYAHWMLALALVMGVLTFLPDPFRH